MSPIPVSNAGTDQIIPYGTSTTIYGSVTGGTGSYNYYWEPASLLINPTAQNPSTKNLYQTTLFTLRAIDATSGCSSLYDTVMVSLEGGPLGITLSVQDDTICKGGSTTITAYGFGGNDLIPYTYTWTDENGSVLKIETVEISSLIINPTIWGTHIYSVNIDDGYNEFTSNITVFVAPTPVFSIAGGPQITACPTDTVLLQPDNFFPGATYYWSNGSTEPSIHLSTTGIGFNIRTLHLKITNELGCEYNDSITVVFDFAACFGIDEYNTFPKVKVFPNPTTGLINIDLEDGQGFSELQILNSQGSVVYEKDLRNLVPGNNEIVADLSSFPKGVYLLRAIHERFIHHQKIVLN